MKVYTFIKDNREGQQVEARSLKKAMIKYGGKPKDYDDHVVITWTSKKKNDCDKVVKLPYVTRKERKGKL